MFSLIGSLFVCSFSSILSALLLIISTLMVIMVMYWNLINLMPLYIFSLFMLGGLYVLIGFVMMADENDLNMVISEVKMKEYLLSFMMIYLGLNLSYSFSENLDLNYSGFSSMKSNDWMTWGPMSGVYIFLIIIMFVFLFVIHNVVKSSMSGGGFVK